MEERERRGTEQASMLNILEGLTKITSEGPIGKLTEYEKSQIQKAELLENQSKSSRFIVGKWID